MVNIGATGEPCLECHVTGSFDVHQNVITMVITSLSVKMPEPGDNEENCRSLSPARQLPPAHHTSATQRG